MSKISVRARQETSLIQDNTIEDPILCQLKRRIYDIFIALRYKIVSDVILQILEIIILVDEYPWMLMQNEIIMNHNLTAEKYKDRWLKFQWLPMTQVNYHPLTYNKYSICIRGTGLPLNLSLMKRKIMEASDSGTSSIRYLMSHDFGEVDSIIVYIIVPIFNLKSIKMIS